MTTIVNTPPTNDNTGSNMTGLLSIVLVVGMILILMYFLLPLLRRGASAPTVTVPDKIDVNVNVPQQ